MGRLQKIIFVSLFVFIGGSLAGAAEPAVSVQNDQERVEVTVYNNNLGLVKDVRSVHLASGEQALKFMDVAAQVIPESVLIRSLTAADQFRILEQNYEFDLINRNKLLDKYIGQTLKLMDYNREQDHWNTVTAELLSNNDGPVYRIDDEIYLNHPGIPVLPELPQNLIAQPTLVWLYANDGPAVQQLEVSYLTRQLSWRADYVLAVNAEDTMADLSGWVTVTNQSGAAYRDARLKLVAGEVQQVAARRGRAEAMDYNMGAKAPPQFREEGFFEYHLYDLQRPTTLRENQTKQIQLLQAGDVAVVKDFVTVGETRYFSQNRTTAGEPIKQAVDVSISFQNTADNGLGMPLPGGIVRLYKSDAGGSRQFIGENRIDHTPKDEEVKLKVGEAFDVVAERQLLDQQMITRHLVELEWEITLRNHKDTVVTVGVVEPFPGEWEIVTKSQDYTKLNASTIRFDVNVPADGEATISYRVRIKS